MYADSFGRWHLNKYHNITMKEYYDKYVKKEDEGFCNVCSGKTSFTSFNKGYREHCSYYCAGVDDKIIKQIKNTKKERYGNENYSNRNKAKKTNLKKYGVENVSQIDAVKQKKKDTSFINYGVENPTQSKEVQKKIKQSCIEKYGVDNPSKSQEIKIKKINTMIEKYGVNYFSQSVEYRKLKEQLGEWIPLEHKSDYELYRMLVWKETSKWEKKLFEKWNGLCYYTNVQLIKDTKFYNEPLYATIDHKKSIYFGFKNNLQPEDIGKLDNLCICSRIINSLKNIKNENEFKIKI